MSTQMYFKMFKLLFFCIVTCLFAVCWSKSIQLEDKPGYCLYKGNYIKEGEMTSSPLGSCELIECKKPLAIVASPCELFRLRPGCTLGRFDYTTVYPDCCPREVC